MNFGSTIKKLRAANSINQRDLADRLSISSTYLSALENNRKKPSFELLENLGRVFNIPREIIFWELIFSKKDYSEKDKKILNLAREVLESVYDSTAENTKQRA